MEMNLYAIPFDYRDSLKIEIFENKSTVPTRSKKLRSNEINTLSNEAYSEETCFYTLFSKI